MAYARWENIPICQPRTNIPTQRTLSIDCHPYRPYIVYVEDEYDNVIDYTAEKLHHMAELAAESGDKKLAGMLIGILFEYLQGTIHITWQDGWPMTSLIDENDTFENPIDSS